MMNDDEACSTFTKQLKKDIKRFFDEATDEEFNKAWERAKPLEESLGRFFGHLAEMRAKEPEEPKCRGLTEEELKQTRLRVEKLMEETYWFQRQ